jgi:hypothetical protein
MTKRPSGLSREEIWILPATPAGCAYRRDVVRVEVEGELRSLRAGQRAHRRVRDLAQIRGKIDDRVSVPVHEQTVQPPDGVDPDGHLLQQGADVGSRQHRLFRQVRGLRAYQRGNDAEVVGDAVIGLHGSGIRQCCGIRILSSLGNQSQRHSPSRTRDDRLRKRNSVRGAKPVAV